MFRCYCLAILYHSVLQYLCCLSFNISSDSVSEFQSSIILWLNAYFLRSDSKCGLNNFMLWLLVPLNWDCVKNLLVSILSIYNFSNQFNSLFQGRLNLFPVRGPYKIKVIYNTLKHFILRIQAHSIHFHVPHKKTLLIYDLQSEDWIRLNKYILYLEAHTKGTQATQSVKWNDMYKWKDNMKCSGYESEQLCA